MYAIIIILALSLFSPLPFISPYEYVLQDAVAQSSSMENFNRQPLKLVNTLYLSPAASITDSTKYPTLYGVNSITTVAIGILSMLSTASVTSYGHYYSLNI